MTIRRSVVFALLSVAGCGPLPDQAPALRTRTAAEGDARAGSSSPRAGEGDDDRWEHGDDRDDDDDDGDCDHDQDRRTVFVDDDRQQCPRAQFTSINAAVQASSPGGHIHVCPGTYPEDVVVDRTLRLHGAGPDPRVRTGDPTREAVVRPQAIGFLLTANQVDLAGFTVIGPAQAPLSRGVSVTATSTGDRLRRNFVSFFDNAIDIFLATGPRSPLSVRNDRLEDNQQGVLVHSTPIPDPREAQVTLAHSLFVRDIIGAQASAVRAVKVEHNLFRACETGVRALFGNQTLVTGNRVRGEGQALLGIYLALSDGTKVLHNDVTGVDKAPLQNGEGIVLSQCNDGLVAGNTVSGSSGQGIQLQIDCHRNTVVFNRSDANGLEGIVVTLSSDNSLLFNHMHDNGLFDAADDNRPANIWKHNQCDTDFPPGTICH